MAEFDPRRARGKRPMPMWWDAFLRDTMEMEADEVGAYMLILAAMWMRPSCDLPNDPRKLARICRVSLQKWNKRIGPTILPFLDQTETSIISWRLRKEAYYVEITVTKQRCRKTKENPDKLLKGLGWGLTAENPHKEPRYQPTQQPNTNIYPSDNVYSAPETSDLFAGQEKKQVPKPKPKPDQEVREILGEVPGLTDGAIDSYLKFRSKGKAKGTTARAARLVANQLLLIAESGHSPDQALATAELAGWQGFKAEWFFNAERQANGQHHGNQQSPQTRRPQNGGHLDALIQGFGEAAIEREGGSRPNWDDG